jgi:hypothetical protein
MIGGGEPFEAQIRSMDKDFAEFSYFRMNTKFGHDYPFFEWILLILK